MPVHITMKSSPRESSRRYERMNSGASTMPTKMFAAVESPTAPPIPNERSNTNENPRTMTGSTRQ